jgi:hypothetical protein
MEENAGFKGFFAMALSMLSEFQRIKELRLTGYRKLLLNRSCQHEDVAEKNFDRPFFQRSRSMDPGPDGRHELSDD